MPFTEHHRALGNHRLCHRLSSSCLALLARLPHRLPLLVCHTGCHLLHGAQPLSSASAAQPWPCSPPSASFIVTSIDLLCTSCISLHSCSSSICRRASASRLSSASRLRVSIQSSFSTSPLLTPARSSPQVPTRSRRTRLSNRALAPRVVSSNVLEHGLQLLRLRTRCSAKLAPRGYPSRGAAPAGPSRPITHAGGSALTRNCRQCS